MFSILLGTRSDFRTFSSQLISKNLPKYNGLHINKHFAEPLVLHPTSPRQALGSIIWLPGEHLTHENFAQLWFIEMKPKVLGFLFYFSLGMIFIFSLDSN